MEGAVSEEAPLKHLPPPPIQLNTRLRVFCMSIGVFEMCLGVGGFIAVVVVCHWTGTDNCRHRTIFAGVVMTGMYFSAGFVFTLATILAHLTLVYIYTAMKALITCLNIIIVITWTVVRKKNPFPHEWELAAAYGVFFLLFLLDVISSASGFRFGLHLSAVKAKMEKERQSRALSSDATTSTTVVAITAVDSNDVLSEGAGGAGQGDTRNKGQRPEATAAATEQQIQA